MDILVIASEGLYHNPKNSFVHNQLKAIVALNNNVKVIVPIAFLKKDICGHRIGKIARVIKIDGIDIIYVRSLSLSTLGSKFFNVESAKISSIIFGSKFLNGFHPSVIWAHAFGFGDIIAKAFQKKYKVPVILTTHGGDTEWALNSTNIKNTVHNANKIHTIVCVSPKLQRELNKAGIYNTTCIINGFQIENVVETTTKRKNQIVQVGHLIESKHFDVTLDALKLLINEGYHFSLKIIGDGHLESDLRKKVLYSGLDPYVEFLGEIDNSTVLKIMAESEYFIMPSYPEGLGIVYLEAMASRCITIGTIKEGIDGVIVNEENGFLVEQNDSFSISQYVKQCVSDEKYMKKISNAAYETAIKYTWKTNAIKNMKVIYKAVN